jgi:hypothetical protein
VSPFALSFPAPFALSLVLTSFCIPSFPAETVWAHFLKEYPIISWYYKYGASSNLQPQRCSLLRHARVYNMESVFLVVNRVSACFFDRRP